VFVYGIDVVLASDVLSLSLSLSLLLLSFFVSCLIVIKLCGKEIACHAYLVPEIKSG
jgi:hypothetical protein